MPVPRWFPVMAAVLVTRAWAGDILLSEDERTFRMENGRLEVVVEKSSGKLLSAALDGRNVLRGGSGYWSMSAGSARSRVEGFGVSKSQKVTLDPAKNGGERAEVACVFQGTGKDGAYPGVAELRYALGKDSPVLHAAAVLRHGKGDAAFHVGEARFLLKLDAEIFNHLSIDTKRNRDMPSGEDWDRGEPLNLKEARRLTSGPYAGSVEHKYGYSAILADTPAYGWCGTKERYGVWMINPSAEYLAGGPTKMELTGHLDVGDGGRPTLLNMWHGSHYGGTALSLKADEEWTKVIGPFAIYFNKDSAPEKLWYEAVQTAVKERRAWPYAWFADEAYPATAARGAVSGKLVARSAEEDEKPLRPMRVGLTSPDYPMPTWRGMSETIGWQRDGKFYQYWTRASADGSFKLDGVRPGTYVLRAFADGMWGEFAKAEVTVAAGGELKLGEIVWIPQREGRTLWQIGVADRSAAEFRNGDRFWEWGNYLRYQEDFPKGVDYVVGRSDWKKDWHICQPLDLTKDYQVRGPSVWTVRFPMEVVPAEGAVLRIAFCGSRQGASFTPVLNGHELAKPELLPENGVMHRDSCRGMWMERAYPVSAGWLKEGENVLTLRLEGNVWHQGVLYDCIRLEAAKAGESAAR